MIIGAPDGRACAIHIHSYLPCASVLVSDKASGCVRLAPENQDTRLHAPTESKARLTVRMLQACKPASPGEVCRIAVKVTLAAHERSIIPSFPTASLSGPSEAARALWWLALQSPRIFPWFLGFDLGCTFRLDRRNWLCISRSWWICHRREFVNDKVMLPEVDAPGHTRFPILHLTWAE